MMGVLFAPTIIGAAEEKPLTAFPSYQNPLTGAVEDAGKNPEIGQPMVEDLIKSTPASLLIDDEGSAFITFRVGLVKESQDLVIELLNPDGKVKESLPYSIVSDNVDDNTRDIRVKVPDQNVFLRVSLMAIPMGREVIGFVSFAAEGEAGIVPLPAPIDDVVDDGSALSIYENANNDEITGVDDATRGQLLLFLGIAAGLLLVIGGVAAVVYFRKKKSAESIGESAGEKPAESAGENLDEKLDKKFGKKLDESESK